MAVREGKVYVYCVNCLWYTGNGQCHSPNNMNINNWLKPEPFEKAKNINKNNDCKWYTKPKWYAAFGWGIRP